MSQQPPSGNLQWFRPKPGQRFPENVQYLGAWRRPEFGDWCYHCGIVEPDGCGSWNLHSGYAEMDLDDFEWLAPLDDGKADPQKTLFQEQEGGE